MNRLSVSISLLFLLVLIVYLPGWLSQREAKTPIDQEDALQANYQAQHLRSSLYNELGELSHQVYASKMEHYQQLGFTLFKQPQYSIYVQNQTQPWQVVAAEGILYEDNRIQLKTDVEIRSQNEQGLVQMVKANFIEINLNNKSMTSNQQVEIIGKGFVTTSQGFVGNLATQEYELNSNVKTIYAPSHQ